VRAAVLDALEDLDLLAYTNELRLYLQARNGRDVPASRFGVLSKDEVNGFGKRPQPVHLCHGLTADRFEPIKRLWGRSDWDLAKRIVAPTTGRVLHLKMTARLCDLAEKAGGTAANPEMLKMLAADHARDVPNVHVKRGKFDLVGWRDAALALLEQLEPRDTARRAEAAEQLKHRATRQQLFGVEMFQVDGGAGDGEPAAGGR
jgi:hypothetical protein